MDTYEVKYDEDTITFTQNCTCVDNKIVVHRVRECVIANGVTNMKVLIYYIMIIVRESVRLLKLYEAH